MNPVIRISTLVAVLLLSVLPLRAEKEKEPEQQRDRVVAVPVKKEIAKSGWNVGLMPAFNYSTDLGFSFGALAQVFHYGDGSDYPNYRHKFMVNAMLYTKGAKQVTMNYDSKHLIPGYRVTADISYMDNPLYGFYGFNGAVSPYYAGLDLHKGADKQDGIAFYANYQRQLRASLDLQGRMADHLTWIGGAAYSWQSYSPVSLPVYAASGSLYEQYLKEGLIPAEDTHGHRAELKAGLLYDTRDFEPQPARGIYASVTAIAGSSFSDGGAKGSLVLQADFRHYISIFPDRLTFAYQLAYSGLVAGSLPFYAMPSFAMRGTYSSRIKGNGVAWASADARLRLASFQAFKQNFQLGLVGFADAGAVVQTCRLAEQAALGHRTVEKTLDGEQMGPYASIYDPSIATRERLHTSVGGGFWYSMNRNFITAVEFGHPLYAQDGAFGLYINLGFSF